MWIAEYYNKFILEQVLQKIYLSCVIIKKNILLKLLNDNY